MYTKTSTGKEPKGSVSIIDSNNRLQLRFRYGGKRYYLSLGLPDTKINRKAAEASFCPEKVERWLLTYQ